VFADVVRAFADEAAEAFDFLVRETGLAGPESEGIVIPVVAFSSHQIRYRIMLDTDDRAVTTRIDVKSGEKKLVAELENLVRAAGIGSPNQVRRSARTLYELRKSLGSQAQYVRQLQACLEPDRIIPLMRAANAREWNIG
jgi:hypothetical protein